MILRPPATHPITPFTGVRIETSRLMPKYWCTVITPFTGVRIETCRAFRVILALTSPPSRGCGLKLSFAVPSNEQCQITPFTGVRIETGLFSVSIKIELHHPLHGGAD